MLSVVVQKIAIRVIAAVKQIVARYRCDCRRQK